MGEVMDYYQGMRALSALEIAERQRQSVESMRQREPLTLAEQAGLMNSQALIDAWRDTRIAEVAPKLTIWARFKRWAQGRA